MREREMGLTDGERERLTGSPRDVFKRDYRASACVFWGVLLICALIATASRLTTHFPNHRGIKVESSTDELGKMIIENGSTSDEPADALIDSAGPPFPE